MFVMFAFRSALTGGGGLSTYSILVITIGLFGGYIRYTF